MALQARSAKSRRGTMSRRGRHGLQVPKRKRSGKAAQLGRPVLASLAQLTPEAWRATFERSAIGIALLDTSGHFLATNSAFQETLGYASEELVGRSFVDFAHEEDRPGNVALAQE